MQIQRAHRKHVEVPPCELGARAHNRIESQAARTEAARRRTRMDAVRGMVDKATGKSKKDDNKSAYRSADASGEPDVGTQSYSRDKSGYGDDSGDRRTKDTDDSSPYWSRGGGAGSYSGGSSGSTGLGGERSATGYSGDSSRDTNPSRRSGGNDDDDGRNYSSHSSGATGVSIGRDETGDMGGGVHGTRGMHGSSSHSGRSSGGGVSGGNQSYGSYASGENED